MFQYTSLDDARRIRALKSYSKHAQANAIDFIDYVIRKFPFRIHTIQTDNGHKFQAKFHWHVDSKPEAPRLNGKAERSHGTDREKFYRLIEYKDDVDLNKKINI